LILKNYFIINISLFQKISISLPLNIKNRGMILKIVNDINGSDGIDARTLQNDCNLAYAQDADVMNDYLSKIKLFEYTDNLVYTDYISIGYGDELGEERKHYGFMLLNHVLSLDKSTDAFIPILFLIDERLKDESYLSNFFQQLQNVIFISRFNCTKRQRIMMGNNNSIGKTICLFSQEPNSLATNLAHRVILQYEYQQKLLKDFNMD
jgi:hypothetical protein